MSLVIAFTGRDAAVIAGDMREILMQGDAAQTERFERELYSGEIRTDERLMKRAEDLGIALRVRDDKCKVADRGGVLIGEVAESEGSYVRQRRLYAAPGRYAIVDIERGRATPRQSGNGSSFVILGNQGTRGIAHEMIRSGWREGSFPDAVRLIILIMNEASSRSASVSRDFLVLQSRSGAGFDLPEIGVPLPADHPLIGGTP